MACSKRDISQSIGNLKEGCLVPANAGRNVLETDGNEEEDEGRAYAKDLSSRIINSVVPHPHAQIT
jgi:hypothetical protein